MTDFFLLHLLAAVAGATFGLMVVWVAVSRRRWLLRFALIAAAIGCLIPVPAFDLAVAAVSQAFVVAGSLSVIRRFTTMREPASESHPNANGWLRFSLSDLLRATLVFAAVFALAAYIPTEERLSLWKYALTGSRFGAATLVGLWAAVSRRRRWIRFSGLCAIAAGVGDRWWAATLCAGFLVSAWICLARRSGLLSEWCGTASSSIVETWRRRTLPRPPRVALSAFSLAMVCLPLAAYYDMLHAIPIPVEPLPNANAYDEVLQIAALLAAPPAPLMGGAAAEAEVSPDERRRVLFEQLHAALRRPSGVPIRYAIGYTNLEAIQALRQLSRDLHAEGARQRLAGKTTDALQTYSDMVELGRVTALGGFVVDRLIGTVLTDLGIEGLREIRDELPPGEQRALIAALQANEAAWEPFAKVEDRERAAFDKTIGWITRVRFAFPSDLRPESCSQAVEQSDHWRSAKIRLLVCHLAIRLYQAERGRPPEDLADLVPDYLDCVPEDPFSGWPLIYKATPPGYRLYSVNRNRCDDGGQRSSSPIDGDLFLDPAELKVK